MIKWYWFRLKAMTPQEVLFRFRREMRYRSYEKGKFKDFEGLVRLNALPLSVKPLEKYREGIQAAADRASAGKLSIFGHEVSFIGWRKDPVTGNIWPQDFFSRLNYRYGQLPGDVNIMWELNRQNFLPVIGAAYALTGNERYSKRILEYMLGWIDENPRFQGINWTSALELALRMISWAMTISPLQGTQWLEIFEEKLATSIYEHCTYINENLSLYSSINYHLIGELTGLIAGCYLLGENPDTEKWLKKSIDLLEKNVKRLFYTDGVSKEQSVYYQCYTMEYCFFSQYILQLMGRSLSREVLESLHKACEFLNCISDHNGLTFQIGDEDGGKVLEILPENWILSLLSWGALLTDDPALIRCKSLVFSTKLAYLYGEYYTERFAHWREENVPGALTKVYPEGGYWVKKFIGEDMRETILTFDFGAVGLPPLSAHGHSDILAINYKYKGKNFFIDPGTYKYDQEGYWRNYFKSAMAHNILTINENNQLDNLGPFLWGKEPQRKLYQTSNDSVAAGHFAHKKEGVQVMRQIDYVPRQLKITDTVKRLRHEGKLLTVKVVFHLDAHVQVSEVKRHVYKLEHTGTVLYLRVTSNFGEDFAVTTLRGTEAQGVVRGWQSRAFYQIEPTNMLVFETMFNDADHEKQFIFYITNEL